MTFKFSMYLLMSFAVCLATVSENALVIVNLNGQESDRTVDTPGAFDKYLTPSTVDRWTFTGKKGELILVGVKTTEFDAILKLVQVADEEERQLLDVDDDGSDAHLALRLPEAGEYRIVVHGYEYKGGGNYRMNLEQIEATEISIGVSTVGVLNNQGVAWFYLSGEKQDTVAVDLFGSPGLRWQARNTKGLPHSVWLDTFKFDESGEYYLRVEGPAAGRFELRLNPAARKPLDLETQLSATLDRKSALLFDVHADDQTFGVFELEVLGDVQSILVPAIEKKSQQSASVQHKPDMQFIEIPSKGRFKRYAVVWGDKEKYQLKLYSARGANVRINYTDPRQEIDPQTSLSADLPLGSIHFFKIRAEAGQALTFKCESDRFDSQLQLYDGSGKTLGFDDDGGGGLNSKLKHLSFTSSDLILAVSSRGYGGGGEYLLSTEIERPQKLVLGEKYKGNLASAESGFFELQATEKQKTIFHLQSEHINSTIRILNAHGVIMAVANSGQNKDAVLVHEFSASGTYIVLLTLGDQGAFQFRTFDPN
ncbi:MAG TPA: hypothetical protein PKD64_07075 [Pirellulaceae bacterium]|nr:hypothetical protein [Pirellulaceae bacterium]HMO91946.1 hypothetical protein [Pirellulaceae bacterium]HMP68745.1 hypothetical protein [Pirellulaceae bacterium]